MSNNKYKLIFILFLIGCFSCSYNRVDPYVSCNDPLPDTISFSKHIIPIFVENCSISGCHSGSSPTGKLNLEQEVAYSQLMKHGSGYIDTINPEEYSVLYSSLISQSDPMPPKGMSDCNRLIILKWMKQKAKNN